MTGPAEVHEHALVGRCVRALEAVERRWGTRVLSLAIDCQAADEGFRTRLAEARPELAARSDLIRIVGADDIEDLAHAIGFPLAELVAVDESADGAL